ncbi:cation transporter [Algoriphagus hitonicola]|uniref:Cation efflux family protein n=1 Tax=Algoriphagus hitonicola TaxID=435880 RepID=A0A1I2RL56_9BACT|nr:cation transporter [Algoriphagus hitonicola]SFG41394.1 Cation efflux family protein [Algoriphagus hitonicola]
MQKTTFHISEMDCPSEENLIRVKLQGLKSVKGLQFDLEKRKLHVYEDIPSPELNKILDSLNLGSKVIQTEAINPADLPESHKPEKKLLWTVLGINFGFFVIEMLFGWISGSVGLIADSLDMLADSFVYGISILAVGAGINRQKKIAGIAGIFQLVLAILGFLEVIRRYLKVDENPDYKMMIIISAFALIANAICLYLLQKSRSEAAHMKASMIFTSNDILINLGVITAGFMVLWLDSPLPDLLIGTLVFGLVTQGAIRIFKLSY